MNCYASLVEIKRQLASDADASGFTTNYDTLLLAILEAGSRLIDAYCARHFYTKEETRYFDGAGGLLLLDDVLSISSFKIDDDDDGTYEETLTATTDYLLYPLNGYPKLRAEISTDTDRDYSDFAKGMKNGVEIVGVWGYGDGESATPYEDSGDSVQDDSGINSTVTTVTVTDADNFAPGQTIRIESEQCYIQSYNTTANTLTVKRGVNGTTAASHDKDTTIYIYQYPDLIKQACIIQAMRWYKRKESAFQDVVGNAELGQTIVYKSLDPDVRLIINSLRKVVIV